MKHYKERNIFKLAAALYSKTSNEYSEKSVLLHVIKCIFVDLKNKQMKKYEICSAIIEHYSIDITEEEIKKIINDNIECFLIEGKEDEALISLTEEELGTTTANITGGINNFIEEYITKFTNKNRAKNFIYTYFYKLIVSNVNSYKVLISKIQENKMNPSELAIDEREFSKEAIDVIRGFLDWENEEKNFAICSIIMCCLEYCLCIAKYDATELMKNFVENNVIYLDTNIIFRALGLNGPERKTVINNFLLKCKHAKISLCILKCTEQEFKETVKYHINKIYQTPRGSVDSRLYIEISDYNIYSYYADWKNSHKHLPLNYFEESIFSIYNTKIREYGIKIVDSTMDKQDSILCEEYKKQIYTVKSECGNKYIEDGYIEQNNQLIHDAKMVRIVEKNQVVQNQNCFIISADKLLRYWSMNSLSNPSLILFPSQFYMILIRLCGRADDDLKSFVSFVNIRHRTQQISASKANIILSAISSVTEDIKQQEDIVAQILNKNIDQTSKEYSDNELYNEVKNISENFLKEDLNKKEEQLKEKTEIVNEQKIVIGQKEQIIKEQEDKIKKLEQENRVSKEDDKTQENKIYKIAEKATRLRFIFNWWVKPFILILIGALSLSFMVLQFVWSDVERNIIAMFFDWLKTTFFGQNNLENLVYIIDVALLGVLGFVFKKWWKNPFDKNKRKEYKEELIKEYCESV